MPAGRLLQRSEVAEPGMSSAPVSLSHASETAPGVVPMARMTAAGCPRKWVRYNRSMPKKYGQPDSLPSS